MNALRLQFKAERELIQKDANRTIGRLNTAIGQVNSQSPSTSARTDKEQSPLANLNCFFVLLCCRIKVNPYIRSAKYPQRQSLSKSYGQRLDISSGIFDGCRLPIC